MSLAERAGVWTRYWASGQLHSCAGSFEGNYGGAIAAFWHAGFASLGPSSRVLDLGCGNGPLARLLLTQRTEPGLRCDAVDLAQLTTPDWAVQEPRVVFHGGCAAERLPFDDGCFDLVASQYGFEYGELQGTASELRRVRATQGRIRLLIHHADSLPVRLAAAEIDHLLWAVAPSGLVAATEAMLEPVARAQTEAGRSSLMHDRTAGRARTAFNAAQDEVERRLADTICPDALHEVRDAAGAALAQAAQGRLPQARAHLQAWRDAAADSLLRLRELRAHALDAAAVRHVALVLARDGETPRIETVEDGGRLLGWGLSIGFD